MSVVVWKYARKEDRLRYKEGEQNVKTNYTPPEKGRLEERIVSKAYSGESEHEKEGEEQQRLSKDEGGGDIQLATTFISQHLSFQKR